MATGAKKTVHVAVGVIWRDGRLLIARRPDSAHQGGLLEFPGGKVEPGESVQQALARELLEETAVTVSPQSLEPLIGIRHDYGDKQVFLDVWQTHESAGEPHGVEGQPVFWLEPEALQADDFPAANRPIIGAIRLPRQLAITGTDATPETFVDRLVAAYDRHRPPMVLLRLPSLSPQAYTDIARQCLDQVPSLSLLVHDRPDLVAEASFAGVHLSWQRAAALSERSVPADRWLGVSCHNREELAHAATIGADYVTLGPVLPTQSHPGAEGMGWAQFAELAAGATVPVYALGGVTPDQRGTAVNAGGQGVAGISWWWPNQQPEAI